MSLLALMILFLPSSFAWDQHQLILDKMMDQVSEKRRHYLEQIVEMPCPNDEKIEIAKLAQQIEIDGAKVPVFSEDFCKAGQKTFPISLQDLLVSTMVDEPDQGMDQNLPDSADPAHDRAWMGGSTGPTSQGFRHMYFAGMRFGSPLDSLQIPFHPVGQALVRIQKLRDVSNHYFASGNVFWGTRTLLWELHFVQDLHQPFHVVQIPSLHLLPLTKLFQGFVKQTAHSIGNYHYAYEGVAAELIRDALTNQFIECFDHTTEGNGFSEPAEILKLPLQLGNALGRAVYSLFGDRLKSAEANLPEGIGGLDYYAIAHIPAQGNDSEEELNQLSGKDRSRLNIQNQQREAFVELRSITCSLIKKASQLSWSEFDRAFLK